MKTDNLAKYVATSGGEAKEGHIGIHASAQKCLVHSGGGKLELSAEV